jgi:hypothetical protein
MGLLGAGLVLAAGCSDSSSDEASLATVHGTVTLHGDWPSTGEVQVSLFSMWHPELAVNIAPQGPPDFTTDALSSPDSTQQVHVVSYEILDINPGSYPSLVVGWRDGGQSGLDEPVLGLFGADFSAADSLPEAITLTAGQDLELNFEGWFNRMPTQEGELEPGQVGGTVEFSDAWPTAYASYYVLLMTSSDPNVPSQPRGMQEVSAANPDFLLNVNFSGTLTAYLVVYGYPYGADPGNAFYGGYGWVWGAASPALTPIVLQEGESGFGGLVLSCRSVRE